MKSQGVYLKFADRTFADGILRRKVRDRSFADGILRRKIENLKFVGEILKWTRLSLIC